MKKLTTVLLFFISLVSFSQIINPVNWEFGSEKISDTEYELVFKAEIDFHWSLYSQFVEEGGPLPTIFSFEQSDAFELVETVVESDSNKVTQLDPVFEMEVSKFYDSAVFKQRIRTTSPAFKLNGNIDYMTCDDSKCIYKPDNPFTFEYTSESGFSIVGATSISNSQASGNANMALYGMTQNAIQKAATNCSVQTTSLSQDIQTSNNSLWQIFGLGFLGGLLALLTPCVFPMIPLTVSFFTKQSQTKAKGISNAILYGICIVVIYLLLSLPFHFLDSINPEILNTISTNVWLNSFFFAILVFFAFSFFGYYEITLPSSWGDKMDTASNVGGMVGIFFMALTLAIISFSCTGPILGSLLAGSLTSDGGAMQLSAGMTGFGLALALPFALFALFPNWLKSLPSSGGWLNTTKVILGFLELAFAFKFLSNADLVGHWDFLKREVFVGIWIVIFIGLALYILKKIRFPHDGTDKKLSFSSISFGILVLAFVVYLIPGTFKTPTWNLSLLSGFPPPQFYSIYEQENDCPLGLNCYKGFEEGLAAAKAANKPILLDFTGWACVNCRKVEENVWSDPAIYTLLKDDYILISLYVDDRKELPTAAQFKFKRANGKLKDIETVGDKWATFQTVNFQTASQPYYVLMTADLEILNHAEQYTCLLYTSPSPRD